MTELREPTSDVQREAADGSSRDLARTEYEQDLHDLARTLHQNIDAISPIEQEQKSRKRISDLASSLVKSNMILTWGLVASVGLNVLLGWFAVHPDRQYFAADGTRVVRLIPLSEPYLTPADVIQFARDAINRSLTINFQQYRGQLEAAREDWTREGFKQFLQQLEAGGYLDAIKTKRMNMTVTAGTGVIVSDRLVDNIWVRKVELPIEIKLTGQVTEQPPQSFIALVTVTRIPTLDSLAGVALDNIVIKPR
jgi:intracellular multiplication protein IcmL|uniref:IncI1 plasmid conjugative transfer protein TraM (DotI) n=1 Tax=Pseudomonas syringae pv. actinidiae TaxID=103796 RepID=A0A2P0QEH9_PSESF|nr:DotI/IcmL/TraM family protein [Pseudomonas syringae]ARO44778.1 IncI1 plasmid conjugative transfer protein TraM (DotI) [Pseudomonas syringae pv. actinidiae]